MSSLRRGFFGFCLLACAYLVVACGQTGSKQSASSSDFPNGSPGGTDPFATSPTASSTSEMQSLATQMDTAASSAPAAQQPVLKGFSDWAKNAAGSYQSLTPGLSLSALASWAAKQKAERDKLLALAQQAHQAQMDIIAEALEDLANRREVFVASKVMKNGGFRFAYFRDPNAVAPYLQGYGFRGVAYQVYEKPQKIASDTADTKLSFCAHSATEEGKQAWVFFTITGGCGGNVTLNDSGYISAKPTSRTSRDLFFTVRLVDNAGKPSSDFVDTFMIAGKPSFDSFVPALLQYHYSGTGTPIGYVN